MFLPENNVAFSSGAEWTSCDGSGHKIKILKTRRWGDGRWEWEVSYENVRTGVMHEKGGWDFQVKYYPLQDY